MKEMLETARARTLSHVGGRHILAIQDTTTARAEEGGKCVALHPLIAVDALDGAFLGLIDAVIQQRPGGKKAGYKAKPLAQKDSRRWLDAEHRAQDVMDAGAACVTVVADREGDIYDDFACRPEQVHVLIRAAQNRGIRGGKLFDILDGLQVKGKGIASIAARPGQRAREAELEIRFCEVHLSRPVNGRPRADLAKLPEETTVYAVDAREVSPGAGHKPVHWRLLTSHKIMDVADARKVIGFYRDRWVIEQLFRTMKTKGFDVEASRIVDEEAHEKLVIACLIAAVTVMQMVRDRDGTAKRPILEAIDREDIPILQALCGNVEGKTAKQKNPHPKHTIAYAAWVLARLGGWTGYYGKPGPIVIMRGLVRFHLIKHGWELRDV